jgi:hypothetical protein
MRWHARRRPALVAVACLLTLAVGLFVVLHGREGARNAAPSPAVSSAPPLTAEPGRPSEHPGRTPPQEALADNIAALEAQPAVDAAPDQTRINGEAASQPDLYAAEFVRRLLTQRYDQLRGAHSEWVQAESAQTTEPLVVGLVPERLRDRLAVHSVTTGFPTAAPVPAADRWVQLGQRKAFTTVRIARVDEPTAWVNAVRAGRIRDPGITGRAVAATVTRHEGTAKTSTSVLVTLNLEGPPTRPTWGFVMVVDYIAVPMGGGS